MFKSSHGSDTEQGMWVTQCKASEMEAPTPIWLLGKPWTHFVGAGWHTGMEGKTLLFIKPGQKGDESTDGANLLSF